MKTTTLIEGNNTVETLCIHDGISLRWRWIIAVTSGGRSVEAVAPTNLK